MQYSKYLSNTVVIGYRALLLVVTLFSLLIMHYERFVTKDKFFLYDMQFFTNITNYLLLIWCILFFVWRNDEEKVSRLFGSVKGALTTYMTIVSLVYMVLISPTHNPEGLFIISNVLHHYVNPAMLVIDTLLTQQVRYQYTWIPKWLVYPILYLGYAMIIAQTRNFYVYFFLDLRKLTYPEFFGWIAIMLSLFVIIGTLFIFINRLMVKATEE